MENSKIGWTVDTFNPFRGCTKVSPGCKFCYAERDSHRNPGVLGEWGPDGTRILAAAAQWKNPEKWNREAERSRQRRRVFCASIADVFEGPETMPEGAYDLRHYDAGYMPAAYIPTLNNSAVASARERLFQTIDRTPWLDWLLLTKRPENVLPIYGNYLHWLRGGKWPDNLQIGASVENQECAERRGPELLKIRRAGCKVAFMSCEPLLEAIDVRPWLSPEDGVNWLIVGGESGAADKVRPMNLTWARMLRDQCAEKDVPFFFKQLGTQQTIQLGVKGKGEDLADIPAELRVREFPAAA